MTSRPGITILSPHGDTIWYVGETVTAMWQVNSLIPISSYRTYLSYENNDWQKLTAHVSLEDNNLIVLHWTIPEDFKSLGSHRMKVEGWNNENWLVVETISSEFLIQPIEIEFGPVASWGLVVPVYLSVNVPFTISATVVDTFGNIITNWDIPLTLKVFPGTLNYLTLGNGTTTGTWANGTVSFAGYQLSNVQVGDSATIIITNPSPTETVVVTVIK